jgi:Nuclease-related domain
LNYARRQQYRRLSRAGRAGAGSVTAALLALVVGRAGAAPLAGLLLLTAVGLGLHARHWLALARRRRVGARSEDDVQRALMPLRAEGWRMRHSLPWQGGGDIDSVAIAPSGIAIAIETRPGRTTGAISLGCASRRRGCHGAGEGGHAAAPLASCAWSVRGASSASSVTFWWSRSIG